MLILQNSLPTAQSGEPRLPGTMPCDADDWLRVDDAYAAQMQYRAKLFEERQDAVLYEPETAQDACLEVLTEALKILPPLGFEVSETHVTCPDARVVAIDWDAPLKTLGHLAQQDICVLEKRGAEHVLTAAALCFPANWRLADKVERPLIGIHAPVDEYDENIARRVQRLFDGVKVGMPLWRFNKLRYDDADLHQPYRRVGDDKSPFIRSERQCILRLPRTDAVVFTIHTFVVRA
jgi:hypothetical protein